MTHSVTARWVRYRDARTVFRRLFPNLREWRRQKLISLALSYWERPDRYA